MKKKSTYFLIFLILGTSFISFSNFNKTVMPAKTDEEDTFLKPELIDNGLLAPEFNITDADSLITYNLTDFQGKMVAIDFFATWCVYCMDSLPYIRQLYLMYPEDMLQIISLDTDTSESNAQISSFRKKWGMDWIVGSDTYGVNDEYDISGIPSFFLINQTGHIVWSEEGFADSMWPGFRATFASYLPDDTVDPIITDFSVENKTEFSIFNTEINIFANITEDRNVKTTQLKIETSGQTEFIDLPFNTEGDFNIINESISIDPLIVYGESHIDLTVQAIDYFDNVGVSSVEALSVANYVDTAVPEIGEVAIILDDDGSSKYNLTVEVEVTEDLLLVEAALLILKGTTQLKYIYLEQFNSTHMIASCELPRSIAPPEDITAKVFLRDAANNTAEEAYDVLDIPENTEKTSLNILYALSALFIIIMYSKRRKK